MSTRFVLRLGRRALIGAGLGVACASIGVGLIGASSALHALAFGLAVTACIGSFMGLRATRDSLAANAAADLAMPRVRARTSLQPEQLADALQALLACAHSANWVPGAVVDGRYRLLQKLAHGAANQVYLAERLEDGAFVALKTVRNAVDAYSILRLTREAQLLLDLDHPNVAQLVDFAMPSDGQVFLGLEYADLGSLWDHRDSLPTVPWGCLVFADVARALHALHQRGWVHGDVSPGNVLLFAGARRPTAKLADFERSIAPSLGRGAHRGAHAGFGTKGYVAPEVELGDAPTAASDVYALAAVAREFLVTRNPLGAVGVSREMRLMLGRCQAEAPAARPSALELANLMDSLHCDHRWQRGSIRDSRVAGRAPRLRALG